MRLALASPLSRNRGAHPQPRPAAAQGSAALDLRSATIVVAAGASEGERLAADVLRDEVSTRTGLTWPIATTWPAGGPVVALVALDAPSWGTGRPATDPVVEPRRGLSPRRRRSAAIVRRLDRRRRSPRLALRRRRSVARARLGARTRRRCRAPSTSRRRRATRCAAISSATAITPTPTTPGRRRTTSATSASSPCSAPTRSRTFPSRTRDQRRSCRSRAPRWPGASVRSARSTTSSTGCGRRPISISPTPPRSAAALAALDALFADVPRLDGDLRARRRSRGQPGDARRALPRRHRPPPARPPSARRRCGCRCSTSTRRKSTSCSRGSIVKSRTGWAA